jgi:Icc-related predicted phosphoesterase
METDKFEKHIKSQFKDRKIQPSDNAWEKISSELNSNTSKKKPVFLWMSIAASVMVLLSIALFYLNGSTDVNEMQFEVVATDTKEVLEEKKSTESLPFQEKEPEVIAVTDDLEKINSVADKKQESIKKNEIISIEDEIEVASVESILPKKSNSTLEISDDIINTKVAGIVAQIDVLEQYSTVTDAEVDSLLKRAQQEILRDKIFKTDKSVDALALLTEVEGELDQSFRDQIFNSLKASFIKVRTAVAARNN